jgi:hypothetical protein
LSTLVKTGFLSAGLSPPFDAVAMAAAKIGSTRG